MLAILTTHPIQYQVPLWQALARDGHIPFEVWYLSDHGARAAVDREFGKSFAWDLPLLEGYPHQFLRVNRGAVVDDRPHALLLAEPLEARLRTQGVTHFWINGWHKIAMWQAVRAAHRAGVKVWLRGESNDHATTARWKRPLKRVALGWFFRRVDAFLCIGSANRRLYRSFGADPRRLSWSPYGVDHDRFAREAAALRNQRFALRRQWGIADDALCVLFCGKFISKKRPMDVVLAVQQRMRRGDNRPVHLLFVGSGVIGTELRAATRVVFDAESAGLAPAGSTDPRRPKASFAGFLNQSKISRAYVAADCLVLPSDAGETWGLVVNEAMASGLPCVVSDAAGCSEDLVAPIRTRLRFPLGDTVALAAALVEIERDPPSVASLQSHAATFGFAATLRTVAALYDGPRRKPAREPAHLAL